MRTGAAAGYVGNFHEAGFYAGDDEFLALIVPFVTDGITAGEPVIIGYDDRKCDLLRAALPDPHAVNFIADTSLYASPARAIEAYRQQFEQHVTAGAEQIRIAGDVPHEGNGGRFAGWDRYESAVNAVWQAFPVWSRCLYDATCISTDVRDVVERTHRRLVTTDGAAASPRYEDVKDFVSLPVYPDPLEASTHLQLVELSLEQVQRTLLNVANDAIDTATADDLLFAVTEAVINAKLHGKPPVTVRIWGSPHRLVVHVHDTGAGPTDHLAGLTRASTTASPGLGLWLAQRLGRVDIDLLYRDDGFTVRVRGERHADSIAPAPAPVRDQAWPAGTEIGTTHDRRFNVHAIDGDGASLCGTVKPHRLLSVVGQRWTDTRPDLRCPHCRALIVGYSLTP